MPGLPSGSPLLSALLWSALLQALRSQGLPRDAADDAALALDDACGGAGAAAGAAAAGAAAGAAPGACALSALQLRSGAAPDPGEPLGAARPGRRRRPTTTTQAPGDISAEEEAELERKIGRMKAKMADASEELMSLRFYENETRWLVTQHPPAEEAAAAPPPRLGKGTHSAAPTRSLQVAAAEDALGEKLDGLRELVEQCSRLDAETRDELERPSADGGLGAEASARAASAKPELPAAEQPRGLGQRLAALQEELHQLRAQIPQLRARAHATRRAYLKRVETSGPQGGNGTAEAASAEGPNSTSGSTAEDSPVSLEGFAHA